MTQALSLVLLVTACSSSPTSEPVAATGTIGDQPVALVSAVSQVVSGKAAALAVLLSPAADACGATSGTVRGAASVGLYFYKQAGSDVAAATDTGVYSTNTAGPGPWVEIDVADCDGSGMPTDANGQGDGSATLTRVTAPIAGTFDFMSGTDHVHGTFVADDCAWTDDLSCH